VSGSIFLNKLTRKLFSSQLIFVNQVKPSRVQVSELTSHTGFWLRFVSNHVSQSFMRKLLDSGVTAAEWVVLREMYDKEEMLPSVLADLTGMTRGAASKLVDRLVAKKLVSRRERTDDRRYQDIALTPAGRRLVPALAAIADQNDEEFFTTLSAKEHKALVATLKKLVRAHGLHKIPTE
jgi:DNA-binding MarR family transcriptional regulator